jgi:hypothetical protein
MQSGQQNRPAYSRQCGRKKERKRTEKEKRKHCCTDCRPYIRIAFALVIIGHIKVRTEHL